MLTPRACRWYPPVRSRIAYIRTLVSGGKGAEAGRSIDPIGQYL
jgi:hypothetical protein